MPSIVISTALPVDELRPDPDGVPVQMMSPGRRVQTPEMNAIRLGDLGG